MANIPVPQNQLNALPLLSVQDVTEGGTIEIVGGSLSRVWTPTQLGINGVAPTLNADGLFYLTTPYLDLRGVHYFMLDLTYTASAAVTPNTMHWYAQHRNGPLDAPAVPANFGNSVYASTLRDQMSASGLPNVPAFAAAGSARMLLGWSDINLSGDGQGQYLSLGGQNFRFIFTVGNAANTATRLTFTAYLEAYS